MKSVIRTVFVLWMTFSGLAMAEEAVNCPSKPVAPTEEEFRFLFQSAQNHGFLWRISKDGHTSYLYGTIHVARLQWMFPGPAVIDALRASNTLALELDVLDPDIMQRLVKGMAEQQGAALPESLAARLHQYMQKECIPEDNMKKMIPEMQIAVLGMAVGRRDGIDPSYAVDPFLAGLGHGAKLNVVSLETPELQLKTLQMETPEETIDVVRKSLDDLDSGKVLAKLQETADAWRDADYEKLEHFKEWCDCVGTPLERKMMMRMLDDRNPSMADRIDALHAEGKQVFAAVGSLHMVGEIGLPALLAKRGYTIERLDLKP